MKKFSIVFFLLQFSFYFSSYADTHVTETPSSTSTQSASSEPVAWDYSKERGPEKWGQLSPEFILCAKGKSQSPIDISHAIPALKNLLTVHYTPAPLYIMEDGLTDVTIGNQSLRINVGKTIQAVNFPPEEYIQYNGDKYHLIDLHFHVPGENQLNGQQFPVEIHFVNQGSSGKLVVIGVFVKPGQDNPVIQRMLDNIPKEEGKPYEVKNVGIDPIKLLPNNKSYYSFLGSLTTPPCTEGVQWVQMSTPIEASVSQINKLKYEINEENLRPIQPLNDRRIVYVKVQ